MFMPHLLRNFLYSSANTGNPVADFAMTSAARELHVSASLSRRLFWTGARRLRGPGRISRGAGDGRRRGRRAAPQPAGAAACKRLPCSGWPPQLVN